MSCPFCQDSKRLQTRVEYRSAKRIKCPVAGCFDGKYATRCRNCGGKGCRWCSTKEEHHILGRALCKFCGGRGCQNCNWTGLFLVPCENCGGTGEVMEELAKPLHLVMPCPFCLVSDLKGKSDEEILKEVRGFAASLDGIRPKNE